MVHCLFLALDEVNHGGLYLALDGWAACLLLGSDPKSPALELKKLRITR